MGIGGRAGADRIQGRHLRPRQHGAGLVHGARCRLLCRAGSQGRHHQHERRQPRRGRAPGRPARRHACRVVLGDPRQPQWRRHKDHRLLEQRHPLHLFRGSRREDRSRPQRGRHRREHIRLGKRLHRHARAGAARPHPQRRNAEGIWRRHAAARGREVRRNQSDADQRADRQPRPWTRCRRPDRSGARTNPVGVQLDRRSASRYRRPARCPHPVPQGDDRRQLSRAHR